jgi:hypothetical protein
MYCVGMKALLPRRSTTVVLCSCLNKLTLAVLRLMSWVVDTRQPHEFGASVRPRLQPRPSSSAPGRRWCGPSGALHQAGEEEEERVAVRGGWLLRSNCSSSLDRQQECSMEGCGCSTFATGMSSGAGDDDATGILQQCPRSGTYVLAAFAGLAWSATEKRRLVNIDRPTERSGQVRCVGIGCFCELRLTVAMKSSSKGAVSESEYTLQTTGLAHATRAGGIV